MDATTSFESYINKKRLINLFCELVRIHSPSGNEEELAKIVMSKFGTLGLEVREDSYGNVIAKRGGFGDPLMLCGHLDTVAVGIGDVIKPMINQNTITSCGNTILGADNKDAIAAIFEMLMVIKEHKLPVRNLEIVLTREEESISAGVRHLDYSLLDSKECIISDQAGDYGVIVLSAPSCIQFDISIIGKRSHVKEPEQGVNALILAAKALSAFASCRIDQFTIFNIAYQVAGLRGVIDDPNTSLVHLSQENRNTIPDIALLYGEIRGVKSDVIDATLQNIESIFQNIVSNGGGIVTFDTKKLADGYLFEQDDDLVVKLVNIFKAQGVDPKFVHSIGGSDANILNAHGVKTVVISSAHEDNHKYTETLYIDRFLKLTDFYLRLVTCI